jgi:class 3 adenylate cyclase
LFADVAGFSKIKEALFPEFLSQYGNLLKKTLNSPAGKASLFANTWGDGLHMVFKEVREAAEFALMLLEEAEKPWGDGGVNWGKLGMADQVPLRVALHTGPVFEVPGVFGGREAYFGQHVNRAARIEPVTGEGCVYASEQFASLLTMAAGDRFQCEFLSIRELAKGYDRCPLYHVTRVHAPRIR